MSIKEEEKRKGLISALSQTPAQDRLTLYLRRPSDDDRKIGLTRAGSLRTSKKQESAPEPLSTPNSPLLNRSQFSKYRFGVNGTLGKSVENDKEQQTLPPSVPRRLHRQRDEIISDKIEIDSDNIETPPATRRKFTKLREDETRRMIPIQNSMQDLESPPEETERVSPEGRSDKETNERGSLLRNSQRLREIAKRNDDEVLGDGQFDRFSSARRTRRYKKGTESSEETPVVDTTPDADDKEARLKKWQNRLKYHGTAIQNDETRVAQEAITDINKFGSELKNIEMSLKEPEKKGKFFDKKNEFIPEIRVQATTSGRAKTEIELNDEGFEETQSLASETPSQGTSNFEADSLDSPRDTKKLTRLNRADSSESADTNTSSSTNPPVKKFARNSSISKSVSTPKTDSLIQRLQRTEPRITRLDRSNSVKATTKPTEEKRNLVRRSSSLRKTDSQSSINSNKTSQRRGVERSNSRTSLRSSRSSLNSSTSVNTVRNVPAKTTTPNPATTRRLAGYTSAIKNLTMNLEKETDKNNKLKRTSSRDGTFGYRRPSQTEIKKPLSQVQLKNSNDKLKTISASRSSSSGSSIGPIARRPKTSTLSTSFKENALNKSKTQIGVSASRSSSSGSSIVDPKKGGKTIVNIKYRENKPRELNFMKPTAASTAKDTELPVPKLRSVSKPFLK